MTTENPAEPTLQAYHPPKANTAHQPLIEKASLDEQIAERRRGFDPGKLEAVARNLDTTVETVRTLIGLQADLVVSIADASDRIRAILVSDQGRTFLTAFEALRGRLEKALASTSGQAIFALLDALAKAPGKDALPSNPSGEPSNPANRTIPVSTMAEGNDVGTVLIAGASADRLSDLEGVIELSHAVFGDPETARRWFGCTLDVFDGRTPTSMLDTTPGRKRVRQVLYAIEFGHAA